MEKGRIPLKANIKIKENDKNSIHTDDISMPERHAHKQMGTITLYFKMKIKEEIKKMIRDLTIIRKTQNKRTGDLTREKEKYRKHFKVKKEIIYKVNIKPEGKHRKYAQSVMLEEK